MNQQSVIPVFWYTQVQCPPGPVSEQFIGRAVDCNLVRLSEKSTMRAIVSVPFLGEHIGVINDSKPLLLAETYFCAERLRFVAAVIDQVSLLVRSELAGTVDQTFLDRRPPTYLQVKLVHIIE